MKKKIPSKLRLSGDKSHKAILRPDAFYLFLDWEIKYKVVFDHFWMNVKLARAHTHYLKTLSHTFPASGRFHIKEINKYIWLTHTLKNILLRILNNPCLMQLIWLGLLYDLEWQQILLMTWIIIRCRFATILKLWQTVFGYIFFSHLCFLLCACSFTVPGSAEMTGKRWRLFLPGEL